MTRVWINAVLEPPSPGGTDDWPANNEGVNDDPDDSDENATPTSQRHMFSYDAPGRAILAADNPGDIYVYKSNFEEFMRVSFKEPPEGDGDPKASRASDKFFWHARLRLDANANGIYVRPPNPGPPSNDIGPGFCSLFGPYDD
jgi:hypothetical protein